ncbi:UGT2A1 family protein [Megaselia abdita]
MKVISAYFIFLATSPSIDAFRILAIFTSCTRSHDMVTSALVKGLHLKGHNVTVLTGLPEMYDAVETLHIKDLADIRDSYRQNLIGKRKTSVFQSLFLFGTIPYGIELTESVLESKELHSLLKRKFDVLLLEDYFNEAVLGLSTVFSAPVVLLRTQVSPTLNQNNQIKVGFSPPMSFVPSVQSTFSDRMTFSERLQNVLLVSIEKFAMIFHMWYQQRIYDKCFKEPKPKLEVLVKNISFVLQNTHESLFYPQPTVPNFKEIGGLHVSPIIKPLPEDIEKFVKNSEEIIYFSFGGNIDFSDFDIEKQEAILAVFQKTKQKVLLKTRKRISKKYKNILIKDWLPQNDILANPKVKVFITHGGLQSFQETVFHAVPIVGIPIYGDQVHNIASAVHKGIGVHLDYGNITEESLKEAIKEVVENEKYKENMVKVSRRYHDRQVSPLDNAVYWIEYVVKYKGADHLKNAGIDLNVIEYSCLDVFAFLMLLFFWVCWLMLYGVKKCFLKKEKVD